MVRISCPTEKSQKTGKKIPKFTTPGFYFSNLMVAQVGPKKMNVKPKRKNLGGTYMVSIHERLRYNCKVQISSWFNDCAFESIAQFKSYK